MLGFLIAAWCVVGFVSELAIRRIIYNRITVKDILLSATAGCIGGLAATVVLLAVVARPAIESCEDNHD